MDEKVKNKKITGFGITSLILGILSIFFGLILGALSIFFGFPAFIAIAFGIISIILGIVEIAKNNKKVMPIIGIVCSSIGIIASILFIIAWISFWSYLNSDDMTNDISSIKEELKNIDINDYIQEKTYDVITGENWIARDGSYLVLKYNGTFKYYKDKDDLTDNYYEGTYEVYNGEKAIDYVANSLSDYSVTELEQKDLIKRNSKYTLNNYYCVVLNNKKCIIDGEDTIKGNAIKTPYIGFYYEDEETLDLTNMNTASYILFTKD